MVGHLFQVCHQYVLSSSVITILEHFQFIITSLICSVVPTWKSECLGSCKSPLLWKCLIVVQGWTQAETWKQPFLGPVGTHEAPQANCLSSGFKLVTETHKFIQNFMDLEDWKIAHRIPTRPYGEKYDTDKGGVTLVSPKQKTQIGTWNKQTMYQLGKVLRVSDTRWLGCGKMQLITIETLQ